MKAILLLLIGLIACSTFQAAAAAQPKVLVGIYVYTWYNSFGWNLKVTPDKPLIGYYDSSDAHVISTQLSEIAKLGVDYVILNWLGVGSFSDRVIEEWFSLAKTENAPLKLGIMVEPYAEAAGYDYRAIYGRAYWLYQHYPDQSLLLNGKPVIFFYNSPVLTGSVEKSLPEDSRFYVMTVGHREYVDFWYHDVLSNYLPPTIPYKDQISVTPRFDDYLQYQLGLRDHTNMTDRYLSDDLYSDQWQRAIVFASHGIVQWITIATWNEYAERTMIEPHYDATAIGQDPFHLYNLTKLYVALLHEDC